MASVMPPTGQISWCKASHWWDHSSNFHWHQEREIKMTTKKNFWLELRLSLVFQIFSCASTLTRRTSRSSPAQRRASLATQSSNTRPAGASGECPNWTALNWSVVPYRTRGWPENFLTRYVKEVSDWIVQTALVSTGPVSTSQYWLSLENTWPAPDWKPVLKEKIQCRRSDPFRPPPMLVFLKLKPSPHWSS